MSAINFPCAESTIISGKDGMKKAHSPCSQQLQRIWSNNVNVMKGINVQLPDAS